MKLAEEGFSQVEIARELNINRRTVAHYIEGVGGATPKAGAAATLTPELIGKLQFLAKSVGSGACPSCRGVIYHRVGQASVRCPQCKEVWSITVERTVQGPTAATASQAYRRSATETVNRRSV